MTIEEKAKAYDEAIKVLHKYDGVNILFSQSLKEEMFPELKESEDERISKALIKLVKKAGEGYENVIDGVSIENAISWLEKQGEQKPAEWSEEDEERIKNILSVLDVQVCWDGVTGKKGNPYQKEINWLKSLRPQNRWKPSDEQMDALYEETQKSDRIKDERLVSLYKQLKAL